MTNRRRCVCVTENVETTEEETFYNTKILYGSCSTEAEEKFGEGRILELREWWNEPAKVIKDNKVIAYGEILVMDESFGVKIAPDEVFVSDGAKSDCGNIGDIFGADNTVLVTDPVYPVYVDSNIMAGREIVYANSTEKNGFAAMPPKDASADIIYLCSPNNPTGAVFTKDKLQAWVDYANENKSVILFDAAYEAFIEDEDIPHSIFEIEGAETCAIEICSLSKTAGFTGTRLGYTVIPKALERMGMSLNDMWVRNRTTKTNGVSCIIQKGAAAVFTDEGQRQIKENIQVYKNNAAVLTSVLDRLGIWYSGGRNAPYIWMKCPGGMSSWEFFDYLLENIQVVGTPGVGFGENGDGYFRFTTFGDPEDTKIAAKRLYRLLGERK
jgi:LL-diaminopimelate aminotransferase